MSMNLLMLDYAPADITKNEDHA